MEKIKAESLEHARQQIDAIDTALVELIAARQFYVDQTTRFKKTETDLQSPERMEQIVENVKKMEIFVFVQNMIYFLDQMLNHLLFI